MTGFGGRQTHTQHACDNCGEVGAAHDKERVRSDDGPADGYHYRYHCPDDSGRRYQP